MISHHPHQWHLPAHSLPFGPFTPKGPGGPLRPGRPLAPACPGKPFSPGIPGGPGGPGFPGKPATPDSGLLKLAANWASCSVGAQQKDNDQPLDAKLAPRCWIFPTSSSGQLSREQDITPYNESHRDIRSLISESPEQLSLWRWSKSTCTWAQNESGWGETVVMISLELLLLFIPLSYNLRKLSRKKIILFISSNQQQKMYVHDVKGLILISCGSLLDGICT